MATDLYIIDGHSHIYAAYWAPMAANLTSPAGEPTKAAYIFTNMLTGLIRRRDPDMLFIAMDSKTPTFRAEIYPEYKAHRPPMPEDMPGQIDKIEQIARVLNIPVIRCEGYEADDIIGTVAKNAASKGIDTYICSKDKDMLQLIDGHIRVYDVSKDRCIDAAALKEDRHVTPEEFLDCLAIQGDTADNVPGVPDVGPHTALKWIQKYGNIENLFEHADELRGKRGKSLRQSKEQVFMSKKLVTIKCDVPIEINYDDYKITPPDKEKITEILTRFGFNRLLKQLGLDQAAQEAPGKPSPATVVKAPSEPDSAETVWHEYILVDTIEKLDELACQLSRQKLISVDTETNSLRPAAADLVGISFSYQPHRAYYIPVRASLGQKVVSINRIKETIGPILADQDICKVAHNIKYDIIVLRNAGLAIRGTCFDTIVACYCLEPGRNNKSMDQLALDFLHYRPIPITDLIGKGRGQRTFDTVDTSTACEYAAEDADITLQLYHYLAERLEKQPSLKTLFDELEMPLVQVLAEMEYNGIYVDVTMLKKMSNRFSDELDTLTEKIHSHAQTPFNIDSPKQLAQILFDRLGLKSVKSGESGPSTDAGVLEKLADAHPIIPLILQYRQISKLKNTYLDKLGSLVNHRTDRVHASFNQTVTATGRLSSSAPNLQNIPIRTDLGKKIRAAFVPQRDSDYLLSADYSQIELRLLAHFSKDPTLCQAFEENRDIHRFVASQIYNVPIDEVTGQMRSNCKAVNFGIIYGQGPYGLSRTTGLGVSEAKQFIDDYFHRYGSIRQFMDRIVETGQKTGYAETILHRRRRIPNLRSKNNARSSQARRLLINTTIQGSAADLIKVAMINIHRRIKRENLPVKMLLQIHDELVFELPADQADRHAQWINHEMTTAIELDVPLKVDITAGPTWLNEK